MIRSDKKHKYTYWPVRLHYEKRGMPHTRTLLEQIKHAYESYSWTTYHPYNFTSLEALQVHQRAARRMWHGWPQVGRGGLDGIYGWTLHLGRLKVIFGRP